MTKPTKVSKLNSAALDLSSSHQSRAVKNDKGAQSKKSPLSDAVSLELTELLTTRYRGINIYVAVMLLLAMAIIWTAVLTAHQVHQYHQHYMVLQDMKAQHRKLQIEQQRLIIEQQTFSATPQIANRAITELGMYSPSTQDKLILQPAAISSDSFTSPQQLESEND